MINLPDGFVLLQNHNGKPLYAACLDGGRFHGWLMSKHPDGQWASNRKLESWEVMQAEDQRDDGIIHETGSTTSAKQALYDVVFKAIAAATCVAGNAVSVSVAQFYTALLSRGYTIRAADALDSQPTELPADCSDEMYRATTHICNLLEREEVNAMWRAMREVVIASSQPTDGGVRNG